MMKKITFFVLAISLIAFFSCEKDEDQNEIPVSNAGVDLVSFVGDTLTLDGSSSSDKDNQELTYSWSILSKPSNSNVNLSNSTTVNPELIPDIGGDYIIQLIVNDGEAFSKADSLKVFVKDIDGIWASLSQVSAGPAAGSNQKDTLILNKDNDLFESYSYLEYEDVFYFLIGLKGTASYDLINRTVSNILLTDAYSFNFDFSDPNGEWVNVDNDPNGVITEYQTLLENQIVEFILSNNGNTLTEKVDFNGDGDYDDVNGEPTDDFTLVFTRVE